MSRESWQTRRENFTEYFWSLVEKPEGDGCWIWRGGTLKSYGRINYQGKRQGAHRVAWQMAHGPIPKGLLVCHHCDVPLCVRPSHLFAGTYSDNMQDWTKKGKNRLVNDRSLWQYGDQNWARSPEGRREISRWRREEFKSGRRVPIRDPATGRVLGTRIMA